MSGAPAAAAGAEPADPFITAVRQIRESDDWARLRRQFATTQLTEDNLAELLEVPPLLAASLFPELESAGIWTVGMLLTAAEEVQKNAAGNLSAEGDLGKVTVPGALRHRRAARQGQE